MNSTDILKHEHGAILLVIQAAEEQVTQVDLTGKINARTVREMTDFFSNFVDRCHHTKGEKHLFMAVHAKGMSIRSGILASLFSEHAQGRVHVRAIDKALSGTHSPPSAATRQAMVHLALYCALLRAHIEKENNCFFPKADNLLTAADQKGLVKAFDKVESEEIGEGVHEKYHAWIEKLVEQ